MRARAGDGTPGSGSGVNAAPVSQEDGEGKNEGNPVFLPQPSMPDVESLTTLDPVRALTVVPSSAERHVAPLRAAPTPLTFTRGNLHAGLGLSRLQSLATMGNPQKFLLYSSFSLEQLLSAVSETKVTTFRFVKKSVKPSGL